MTTLTRYSSATTLYLDRLDLITTLMDTPIEDININMFYQHCNMEMADLVVFIEEDRQGYKILKSRFFNIKN